MHMAHIDEEVGEIWFSTGKGGSLADEIDKEATTLLVFQSSFQSSRMVAAPWESFARVRV
jgi:general stress protein 26